MNPLPSVLIEKTVNGCGYGSFFLGSLPFLLTSTFSAAPPYRRPSGPRARPLTAPTVLMALKIVLTEPNEEPFHWLSATIEPALPVKTEA